MDKKLWATDIWDPKTYWEKTRETLWPFDKDA